MDINFFLEIMSEESSKKKDDVVPADEFFRKMGKI